MDDVIIIGAGLAGLLATWRLRRAGRRVRLFEARDRVGGRIARAGAPPVEVGPSWVWDHEARIHALLRELDLSTFAHHDDGLDLYDDGQTVQVGRLPRGHVPERRIRGGTFAIVDALVDRVGPIDVARPVRSVEAAGTAIRVRTDDAAHLAAAVLIAAPPALAARTIALPDLDPDDRAWLRGVPTWMEDTAKVVARYPRRFWRDRGLSGRAFSAVGPLTEVHDLSGPEGEPAALFGFVHRARGAPDWRERVRLQLGRLFGPEAAAPDGLDAVAWWTEPWTSVPRDEPADEALLGHARLRAPRLGGRLHLLSTETARESPGHLDGAVERAEEVVATLCR